MSVREAETTMISGALFSAGSFAAIALQGAINNADAIAAAAGETFELPEHGAQALPTAGATQNSDASVFNVVPSPCSHPSTKQTGNRKDTAQLDR
jgi:hypothetical protein